MEEIVKSLMAIASMRGRRRRDSTRVAQEYDQGQWKRVLEQKPWKTCSSIEEFLNPESADERIAKINNSYVRIRTTDYYKHRFAMLENILRSCAETGSEVVELGCGYGMNLFSLSTKKWNKLTGLDISAMAIEAAREISRYFGLGDKMHFDRLDLTDRDDRGFGLIQEKTVFTYYCLEQLKHRTALVIANMIRARPKKVIHIEPTPELLRLWLPKDLINYLYILRQDYQDNLIRTLRGFEKRGELKIVELRPLYFAPSVKHDPTLICWEPIDTR